MRKSDITFEIVTEAWSRYQKEYEYISQRFGQYFFNTYIRNDERNWPELFYESDAKKACKILYRQAMRNLAR